MAEVRENIEFGKGNPGRGLKINVDKTKQLCLNSSECWKNLHKHSAHSGCHRVCLAWLCHSWSWGHWLQCLGEDSENHLACYRTSGNPDFTPEN